MRTSLDGRSSVCQVWRPEKFWKSCVLKAASPLKAWKTRRGHAHLLLDLFNWYLWSSSYQNWWRYHISKEWLKVQKRQITWFLIVLHALRTIFTIDLAYFLQAEVNNFSMGSSCLKEFNAIGINAITWKVRNLNVHLSKGRYLYLLAKCFDLIVH